MPKLSIPTHLIVLFISLLGILGVSGTRVKTENMHDPIPRVLSMFTQVPDGFVKVVDTVDGDTIKVLIDGQEKTVRLLGVDTPETKDPRKKVQCFGHAASDFTKKTLEGKAVHLIMDSTQGDTDKYHRLLRYVYLEDGTMLNELLVREGYAFAYERFPTMRLENLKELEKIAREQKKGLWGGCEVSIKNGGQTKSTQTVE